MDSRGITRVRLDYVTIQNRILELFLIFNLNESGTAEYSHSKSFWLFTLYFFLEKSIVTFLLND